ncbi:hypothetical protein G7Y89_g3794 [Cudoniella acicularis]|uniref:Uncharacterized protein n=1 Tax=Cudoniella acicularis TaxID=354080 RepID=A0A8H4RTN3_9HELO|nr:hypothetical protein G7Y89_g3794 [Cudoniella acicularis]
MENPPGLTVIGPSSDNVVCAKEPPLTGDGTSTRRGRQENALYIYGSNSEELWLKIARSTTGECSVMKGRNFMGLSRVPEWIAILSFQSVLKT